jgi:hypothetical protein
VWSPVGGGVGVGVDPTGTGKGAEESTSEIYFPGTVDSFFGYGEIWSRVDGWIAIAKWLEKVGEVERGKG